jgi:hypothetical protein
MKYTVTWKPLALQQLADIWLAASDRDAVNAAVGRIDHHLKEHASASPVQLFGSRLIVARPLVVMYDISHDDFHAQIVRVGYRP